MVTNVERARDIGALVFGQLEELANAVWVPPCLAADFLSALSGLESFDGSTLSAAKVDDVLTEALRVRDENIALLTAAAKYDADAYASPDLGLYDIVLGRR